MALCAALTALPLQAHQFRSAYVLLTESAEGGYDLQTRVPVLPEGRVASIDLPMPTGCTEAGAPRVRSADGYLVRNSRWRCGESLLGAALQVAGIDALTPDVLVELRFAAAQPRIFAVTGDDPAFVFEPAAQPRPPELRAYFGLGVGHIALGIDHLLFVLGLLLVVWRQPAARLRRLLATITAFTAAHSITLAVALLDAVRLPAAPVEATIAASILLLAVELARTPDAPGLIFRYPWLPAFAFGLLHGFGFAGALSDIGLPENARVTALALFNLGVEAGQLAFVAVAVAVAAVFTALRVELTQLQRRTVHVLGAVAGFWVIERTLAVLA